MPVDFRKNSFLLYAVSMRSKISINIFEQLNGIFSLSSNIYFEFIQILFASVRNYDDVDDIIYKSPTNFSMASAQKILMNFFRLQSAFGKIDTISSSRRTSEFLQCFQKFIQ